MSHLVTLNKNLFVLRCGAQKQMHTYAKKTRPYSPLIYTLHGPYYKFINWAFWKTVRIYYFQCKHYPILFILLEAGSHKQLWLSEITRQTRLTLNSEDLLASASKALGIKACTAVPSSYLEPFPMGESELSEGAEEVIPFVQSLTMSLKSTVDFLKRGGRHFQVKPSQVFRLLPLCNTFCLVDLVWLSSVLETGSHSVGQAPCNSLYRSSWSGTRGGSLPANSENASMTHMTDSKFQFPKNYIVRFTIKLINFPRGICYF